MQVVISPNGQDVITISEDGAAQVWDMNVGDCVMQVRAPHGGSLDRPQGCASHRAAQATHKAMQVTGLHQVPLLCCIRL